MDELDIPPERAQCEGYFCFAASQHALQRAEPRPGTAKSEVGDLAWKVGAMLLIVFCV